MRNPNSRATLFGETIQDFSLSQALLRGDLFKAEGPLRDPPLKEAIILLKDGKHIGQYIYTSQQPPLGLRQALQGMMVWKDRSYVDPPRRKRTPFLQFCLRGARDLQGVPYKASTSPLRTPVCGQAEHRFLLSVRAVGPKMGTVVQSVAPATPPTFGSRGRLGEAGLWSRHPHL